MLTVHCPPGGIGCPMHSLVWEKGAPTKTLEMTRSVVPMRPDDIGITGTIDRDAVPFVEALTADEYGVSQNGVDHELPAGVVLIQSKTNRVIRRELVADFDQLPVLPFALVGDGAMKAQFPTRKGLCRRDAADTQRL